MSLNRFALEAKSKTSYGRVRRRNTLQKLNSRRQFTVPKAPGLSDTGLRFPWWASGLKLSTKPLKILSEDMGSLTYISITAIRWGTPLLTYAQWPRRRRAATKTGLEDPF